MDESKNRSIIEKIVYKGLIYSIEKGEINGLGISGGFYWFLHYYCLYIWTAKR